MAELATVRVHRPWVWWQAGGTAVVIEVDGWEVGRLRNGQNLATYVETGRHHLRARQLRAARWAVRSVLLELALLPGEDVRLETRHETRNFVTWQLSLVRTDAGAAVPHALPDAQVLGATEMHRSEESLGTENLRIENTNGAARLTRTVRVTREWSRTVSLDHHSSRNITLGLDWLALQTSIEQSLARMYSISASHREEFAEEFSVELDPGAVVTVVLAWKRLWQHGVAQVLTQGRQVEVPFQVAVGITFDQSVR